MRTYKHLYEKMLDPEIQKEKMYAAAKRKTDRNDVRTVLDNMDKSTAEITEILMNTAPPGIPVPHPEKAFKPVRHAKQCINEHSCKKVRQIAKPDYKYEQIIHHLAVHACKEVFTHGMYEYTCGSVPSRGPHYGKRYIEKALQNDKKNTKYIGKFDIRHFYESIDTNVLKELLAKYIADKRMLYLLELIIDAYEDGLPLGYYTSQWFANFLLQDLDHYIKETIGIKYYVRYLDDMVIMGANKKELHQAQILIEKYLREVLHLRMKRNWQIFRFECVKKAKDKQTHEIKEVKCGRPLDFMGFVFYRTHTEIRKNIMLTATRKAKKISKKKQPNWYDASAMLSYLGYFKHTDSYNCYLEYIKPCINVKKLKKTVSRHQRRENKHGTATNTRMEKESRNAGRTADRSRHNLQSDNRIPKERD